MRVVAETDPLLPRSGGQGLGAVSLTDRRGLLLGGGVCAGSLLLPTALHAAATATCTARTPLGALRGLRGGGADSYLGVPYGGQVSGTNRFKRAAPVRAWRDERDATRLAPASIQRAAKSWAPGEPANAEECLYLNVWTPTGAAPGRPVMVYSHGGGLTLGSSGTIYTNGARLAAMQDVVVVSTNHRLGLLGFLYLDHLGGEEFAGSGNLGLGDIALALEWVQANIASFGGDPGNVMIFGESGGGLKTSCLYAMPAASRTFHKASIESGPGIRLMETGSAMESTEKVLSFLGLGRANWREVAAVPPQRILDAQEALASASRDRTVYNGAAGIGAAGLGGIGPVLDGHVFSAHPFDPGAPAASVKKPLLVGGNAEEETSFALMRGDMDAFRLGETALLERLRDEVGGDAPALIAAVREDRPGATPSQVYMAVRSALFSGIGSRVIAERKHAQGGAPVHLYTLAYARGDTVPGTAYPFGALHGLDMPIKFANTDPPPAETGLPPLAGLRRERVEMARIMTDYWASFARTGVPSAAGQPEWPAYTPQARAVLSLDVPSRVTIDPDPAQRRFWSARSAA
jgi:para-nitrobenzyl esterase